MTSVMVCDERLDAERLDDLSSHELADRANAAAVQVEENGRATVAAAIQAGMFLIAAKSKCRHGEWEAWLAANWHRSSRMARKYMQMASDSAKRNRGSVFHSDPDSDESLQKALRVFVAKETRAERQAKKSAELQQAQVAKTEKVAGLLREGRKSWGQIAAEAQCGKKRVREIYESQVMPELLKVDWEARAKSAVVKAIQAAKDQQAILASARTAGHRRWAQLARERLGLSERDLECATRIVRRGCSALISRAEAGDISLSAAYELAKLPHDEQRDRLKDTERKRTVDAFVELRSRASTMLDQKLGWQQLYGTNGTTLCDLAQTADADELSEVVRCFETVGQWCQAVGQYLRGE